MRLSVRIVLALLLLEAPTTVPAALAAQRPESPFPRRPDSTRQRTVIRREGRSREDEARRYGPSRPATPAMVASAYRDTRARETIARARTARDEYDSTLASYDATVRQRLSAGLNVKMIGRDRLLFRSEVAARVRWIRPNRAWVDILGARTAVPVSFKGAKVLTGIAEMVPIPYFAGSERLMWWHNYDDGDVSGDDDHPFSYVHPLDDDAESVYEYRSGDSLTIRLPNEREIVLREVTVRAREARSDLIIGSLWFERGSGQLVRAVFRPSAPFDMMRLIGEDSFEDVPAPVRATFLTPYTFEVESFTIEYGLYGDRWWLPRTQTARAEMRMGVMRSPATIEQSFRYAAVNGVDSLPSVPANARRISPDFGDDMEHIALGAVDGVIPGRQFERRERPLRCRPGDTAVDRQRRGPLRVTVSMPCDTVALLHSKELPPSIFDGGEEVFGLAEARALARDLDVTLQPMSAGRLQRRSTYLSSALRSGLLRYNRVEGLSLGALRTRPLGNGYAGSALARLGTGDLEPNVELRVSRGTEERSVAFAAYRRLDSANDWGDPFGLGGSLSAFLFGRDEGFYYRSTGTEIAGAAKEGAHVAWSVFAERQQDAPLGTHVSLPNAFSDSRFDANVEAATATQAGARMRIRGDHGLDPRGLRIAADVRAEAATGTFDYARGAADVSATRALIRDLSASLTLGAGTSGGTLAPQRLWRVGGTHTVRGQAAGVLSGDSYWLARGELGLAGSVLRPLVFYDVGWAGSRREWTEGAGRVRGAGAGLSFLDGLARIDVARGVRPGTSWRAHLYVEAVF